MESNSNTTDINNLKFTQQFTVAEFKSMQKDTKIDIVKNPHTDKIFFVCGNIKGKVSKKGYSKPVISLCTDETNGETFYMLHSQSDTNVVDSL
jgi:hypothetical protein